jgi:preprotein translocase subunit SecB
MVFTKVHVELSSTVDKAQENWAPSFDANGVEIHTEVTFGVPEDQASDPRNFMVAVRLAILNNNEEKKRAPYIVDVHAQGWFDLLGDIPLEKREGIVRVNGASMILGAIREVVLQISSRSAFGPFVVPTMRFLPPNQGEN